MGSETMPPSPSLGRAELNAKNNAQHVLTGIRGSRPKNTRNNYDPKQREFQVSGQPTRSPARLSDVPGRSNSASGSSTATETLSTHREESVAMRCRPVQRG
jgi:hypothetical protein